MTNVRNYLDTCCIYVGTYKKYNEGNLFGEWLNLYNYSDFEELEKAMKKLHKDEQEPEFMIQDWECSKLFQNLRLISESYISKDIYEIAQIIDNSDYEAEVIEAFVDCFNESDIYIAINKVNECYYGKFSQDKEFVQYILEESGDLPQLPSYIHIDWERTTFDIMMDYSTSNNHYFRNY